MLIRFFVGNFLSFDEPTEFSMVAGQGLSLPTHTVKNKKRHIPTLLKTGLIYGANGSGKSNFVKAIDFAKKLVVGLNLKNPSFQAFKHNHRSEKPTSFQFDILLNDSVYSYGFEILNQQIHTEYLHERGAKKDKIIFERKNAADGKTLMNFDIHFKNKEQQHFLEFIAKACPKDTLFLYECWRRNVFQEVENLTEIENVNNWIGNGLKIMFPDFAFDFTHNNDDDNDNRYLKLLSHFSIDMKKFYWQEIEFKTIETNLSNESQWSFQNLADKQNVLIKSEDKNALYLFKKENNELLAYKFASQHEGSEAIFEFNEESDGTKRLFDFFPVVGYQINCTFIIDEIDRSLHPHLSKALLSYFLENQQDTNSQFIATTHESSLLDLDLLRKDEIWFAEKNSKGATELYSLEEFKPRADSEIRRGYLQGRYGAIPFIPNSANQKW